MTDNISLILSVIIGSIVIVFIPVITILQYQNNVTYNMALSLTTEFVENVKQKGTVTAKEYEEFLDKLMTTSNNFKVEIEAHKRQLVKDLDEDGNYTTQTGIRPEDINGDGIIDEDEKQEYESSISYTDEELIDFTDEILDKLYGADGIYRFEQNDEIYVNVYNTNITMLDKFTSAIFGTSMDDVKKINISLGGKIFATESTEFTQTDFATTYAPYLKINIPEGDNWTTVSVGLGGLLYSGEYPKAELSTIGETIKFSVTLYNARYLFGNTSLPMEDSAAVRAYFESAEGASKISGYIKTNGFTADNIKAKWVNYNATENKLDFELHLSGIYLQDYSEDALFSITIRPGFASGPGTSLSASVTSSEFLVGVPFDDGPPAIFLSALPSKIVTGDNIMFEIVATDLSGVTRFDLNMDEFKKGTYISGFGYESLMISKEGQYKYRVYINGIKDKAGDNTITIPQNVATDNLGQQNSKQVLGFPNIRTDSNAPEILSVLFTVDGNKVTTLFGGETVKITVQIWDDSNYSDISEVYFKNNIKFTNSSGDEVKTYDGKRLNDYITTTSVTGPMGAESTVVTVDMTISSFPDITSDNFKMVVPSGMIKDKADYKNVEYKSESIIFMAFDIKYTVNMLENNSAKILITSNKSISNIDEIDSEIVELDGISAQSITVNKISSTSFEINLTQIVSDDLASTAVVIKEGSIHSPYGAQLSNEEIYINLEGLL